LFCFAAVSFASTNNTGEKEDKEELATKVEEKEQEVPKENATNDTGYMPAKPDSTANFNTSCKFNFIFYFIYKMKYDDNAELESKLNYTL